MKKDELKLEICNLLSSQNSGMLSTFVSGEAEAGSRDATGYPFGSMIRYVIANDGAPLLMLSRIAEHSKHVAQQPNVSLLVSGEAEEGTDIQQVARLTILGELQRLEADSDYVKDNADKYFQQFPESKEYFEMLDFDFYRLDIHKQRYIGGFARAHWVFD